MTNLYGGDGHRMKVVLHYTIPTNINICDDDNCMGSGSAEKPKSGHTCEALVDNLVPR